MKIDNCLLKNFLTLSEDEKLMVLKWRNYNGIRLRMYNSNIINIEDHFNFIDKLEDDSNNKYFLVVQNKKDIGVIYFNHIENDKKECEFGLYANPYEKIVGVGRILEEVSIKYAFDILKLKKLKLEVFNDNKQVINLHKKYNFIQTGVKVMNSKEVICMELENESR